MSLYFVNLVLVIISLTINIIASVVIIKKNSLKPFQVTFINILFLNILYAICRLPFLLIAVTLPKDDIIDRKTLENFGILTAVFIIHPICLFVTFLTFQRLIAVIYPMKFPKWITKRNTRNVSISIYVTTTTGFSVCSVLIIKLSIESSQIDRALCWLFVIESLFIVISYAIIIWKTKNFKFHSSAAKQEYRLVKISILVSVSFLISYFPITLYLLLKSSSDLFYRIAQWMLWIDNLVNPLVIILDNRWTYCICKMTTGNNSTNPSGPSVQVTTQSNLNPNEELPLYSMRSISSTNGSDA